MRKTTAAVLIGVGAGIGLAWLLMGRFARRRVEVHLTLKGLDDGGVTFEPFEDYVELRKGRGDTIHWIVSNPEATGYDGEVEVAVGGWSSNEAGDTSPVKFDDGHSRTVKRGGPAKQMPAKINQQAPPNHKVDPPVEYKYNVYVNGQLVLDPIVKLIL
jgi:hypothetical protein